MLIGAWTTEGIELNGNVYRLDDLEGFEDLYAGIILGVREDGTFTILDGIFRIEGDWITSWKEGTEHAYTLQAKTVIRFKIENGEFVTVSEQAKTTQYRVWMPGEDPNTIIVSDPDSPYPLYYVREGMESSYLAENSAVPPGD